MKYKKPVIIGASVAILGVTGVSLAASHYNPQVPTKSATVETTSTVTPETAPVDTAPAQGQTQQATPIESPAVSQADQNKAQVNALITTRCQEIDITCDLQIFLFDKYITQGYDWNDLDTVMSYPLLNMFLHPTTDPDGTIRYITLDNGRINYLTRPAS